MLSVKATSWGCETYKFIINCDSVYKLKIFTYLKGKIELVREESIPKIDSIVNDSIAKNDNYIICKLDKQFFLYDNKEKKKIKLENNIKNNIMYNFYQNFSYFKKTSDSLSSIDERLLSNFSKNIRLANVQNQMDTMPHEIFKAKIDEIKQKIKFR